MRWHSDSSVFRSTPTKYRQNMPKLTDTYARKILQSEQGTQKFWDSEIKGLVLFVGKQSKT
jgi:hypothetical protein